MTRAQVDCIPIIESNLKEVILPEFEKVDGDIKTAQVTIYGGIENHRKTALPNLKSAFKAFGIEKIETPSVFMTDQEHMFGLFGLEVAVDFVIGGNDTLHCKAVGTEYIWSGNIYNNQGKLKEPIVDYFNQVTKNAWDNYVQKDRGSFVKTRNNKAKEILAEHNIGNNEDMNKVWPKLSETAQKDITAALKVQAIGPDGKVKTNNTFVGLIKEESGQINGYSKS